MAVKPRPNARKHLSREEALKQLAQKEVAPAYRGPRGNPETDRDALAVSVGASERLLTH